MANQPNQSKNDRPPAHPSEEAAETGQIPPRKRKPFIINLVLIVAAESLGNTLIKYSMSGERAPSADSLADIPLAAFSALTNPWLDLAIVLLVSQFILLIYLLRVAPLSLVIPVRGASAYVFTALLAIYVLGEEVTIERWAALAIILVGVSMVGATGGKG